MEDVVIETVIRNPLAGDLNDAVDRNRAIWEQLRDARIFITGGTGFVGCWLLETLLWANAQLSLNASVTVLTRNRVRFFQKAPHLASDPAVALRDGDVRFFDDGPAAFTHVIHGAFSSGSVVTPKETFDTLVGGTRRILDFARRSGACRFLLMSSGAVYGPQPEGMSHIPETYTGAPDPMSVSSAYGEGKRAAELMCALHATADFQPIIARCFAFVGPYLPTDAHFAVGNFIRDALAGRSVHVAGDGTTVRSYLYASDLAVWLWTLLVRGALLRPYNVGSENAISIADLARTVADLAAPGVEVVIARSAVAGAASHHYVPSTERVRSELGLAQTVGLQEACRRTLEWHRARVNSHAK